MSDYEPNLNYRKCKWCGFRPKKECKYCPQCGREYREVYSKKEEKTMLEGFKFSL